MVGHQPRRGHTTARTTFSMAIRRTYLQVTDGSPRRLNETFLLESQPQDKKVQEQTNTNTSKSNIMLPAPNSMSIASTAGNCKFAIPKKGRLFEKVNDLLKGAGIEYHRAPRLDIAFCKDIPLTLVFLPASDIAKYVGEGNVDIGITGLDVVKESNVEVNKIMDLGFGGCRLCVQAPIADNVTDVSTLAGGRIVTSFPHLTEQFFKPFDEAKGVKTKITEVSGSVEAACGLGLADAVVDLVETGTTMKVSWPVVSTRNYISSFHSSIFSTIGCWIGSGW